MANFGRVLHKQTHPYMAISIKNKSAKNKSITIAPFKKNIRKTKPHQHGKYVEIVFLSKAQGIHAIDDTAYEIQDNHLFVIQQNQVHFWDLQADPKGYVIIISKAFIDACLDVELNQLINRLMQTESLVLPKDNLSAIFESICQLDAAEITLPNPLLNGWLKVLLASINLPQRPTPHHDLYSQLLDALQQQRPLHNKVSYYAQLLHTSPQNLNAHCRKASQQSAHEIISHYLLTEAERLLIYSQLTIKEIGYGLGFKDNSHFTKFFKSHKGFTPKELRKSN